MSNVAVAISCILNPEKDNTRTSFVLDTVNDDTISATSTITTHPIVTGDIIADHMFNNPNEMNISGTFSLNGSKGIIADKAGLRLENLQEQFEYIKRNGILCDVVRIKVINENQPTEQALFKVRKNMVLTRIAWTEKVNSLDFSFSFTEALVADVEELAVDLSDKFLPDVTDPQTLNFTDSLLNWEDVDRAVIESLKSNKLITSEFLSYLQSMTATKLVALGVAAAVAVVLVTALNCIPVVGQIITIAIAAVAVYAIGIYKLIKGIYNRTKYRIKQFKLYKKDKENQKEVQRFSNFMGEIHKQISKLNDYINVYNVSSDEPQECIISIDNNYYIFAFTRNNTNGKYSLVVSGIDEEDIKKTVPDITTSLVSVSECTSSNYLFRADETGRYVYLFCPNEDKSKLTNYYILTSGIEMEKFNKTIEDIIRNALLY